ncbi:MAG: hypothetical protein OXB86_05870 [Bdellovibrionales bacterium]|nr:hypothetical protein [Bdellovibrionales bacterium]
MFEIFGFVHAFQGQREIKSEFGFDTVATGSRSVAKRMFELLISLWP